MLMVSDLWIAWILGQMRQLGRDQVVKDLEK